MKLLHWILMYLKDWKNLLAHSIVGVLILVVALFLPVEPIFRIIILVIVIVVNTVRMARKKKEKES